jgi:hypothetical protein
MQARRQAEVDRRKMQSQMNMQIGPDRFQLGSKQIMIDAPGRRLDRNAEKGFGRD